MLAAEHLVDSRHRASHRADQRPLCLPPPTSVEHRGPSRSGEADGVTNDALYLDSTLAINPETGKLAWYFQHQANGQWDLDWAFERQVMQIRVNGEMQTVV